MQFTFTLRDARGKDLDTFIKLGERYKEGFRLKQGEHIIVFNNMTKTYSEQIDNNDDLEVFVNTIYFQQWSPLAEHQELKGVDPMSIKLTEVGGNRMLTNLHLDFKFLSFLF